MMVAVVPFVEQLEASDAVPKIKSFDHAHALQQMHRAVNGGQVAIALGQRCENLFVRHRVRMAAQDLQDGLTWPGDFARFAPQALG